ncbi:transcription antitermination factor NusB [Siphonobacter aquaeclarae]|jgi:N utilization substance protein B|uniref:NusB antitermination factor n=1 Tax=Siphonobacter aquaeclarae TaxID=563176 RepID=A0A1G9YR69_9BACT|nr:transcription antitermination factor NusB [Siphonobacter aquaeclarae]MBO9638696.1 transcription antitermination factor NusB [Siphonobacter aquaeclarae]SDN11689.1 NusB antitermination factor [Siphonobacter aquaeclarae]
MLNRRTLRIKAMQTLYALHQAERSNYQLAQDFIVETLQPDLNSMEKQDPERFEGLRKLALLQLEETVNRTVSDEEIPAEARRVATEAVNYYRQKTLSDRQRVLRTATDEIEQIYNQYLTILLLLLELGDEARLHDERKYLDDGYNTRSFADNQFITALRELSTFESEVIRRNLKWTEEDRVQYIRPFFKDIRQDETFRQYCQRSIHTAAEDADIVMHLVKQLVFKNELIKAVFDEQNLYWAEDKDILRSLTTKTIKSFQEGDLRLQTLLPGGDDDVQFFKDLLRHTLDNEERFIGFITEQVTNWDSERIAITDKILLMMALSEMIYFPGIPVKVTINEFIEVAKDYSTPRSGQFLNGVLDTLSAKLRENGTIRKSGRGLIDNR